MKYILKNKDKNILEFEVEKEDISCIKNINIISEKSLPLSVNTKHIEYLLEKWINKRKIPQNRDFVDNILDSIPRDSSDFMAYIDVCFGLSLNDSFWIVPSDKEYKWKDYNLYENKFNEALELIALGLKKEKINGFISSPEFTTNGMLKKCWHRENNNIYLYKGQMKEYANMGKEAYCEYYMAQVAEIMGFDYVSYDLKLFYNEIICACPIFTSEKEGYVPIYVFLKELPKHYNKLKLVREIIKIYDEESFENLMLFDALICNKDRHLGNFGMIVDNDTNEILRPAPIFDNGFGILNFIIKDELKNINLIASESLSYFDFTFDEQLKLFSKKRHKTNLERLSEFSFQKHPEFNLSDEWLESIESCIRNRAKMALNFIEGAKINEYV